MFLKEDDAVELQREIGEKLSEYLENVPHLAFVCIKVSPQDIVGSLVLNEDADIYHIDINAKTIIRMILDFVNQRYGSETSKNLSKELINECKAFNHNKRRPDTNVIN